MPSPGYVLLLHTQSNRRNQNERQTEVSVYEIGDRSSEPALNKSIENLSVGSCRLPPRINRAPNRRSLRRRLCQSIKMHVCQHKREPCRRSASRTDRRESSLLRELLRSSPVPLTSTTAANADHRQTGFVSPVPQRRAMRRIACPRRPDSPMCPRSSAARNAASKESFARMQMASRQGRGARAGITLTAVAGSAGCSFVRSLTARQRARGDRLLQILSVFASPTVELGISCLEILQSMECILPSPHYGLVPEHWRFLLQVPAVIPEIGNRSLPLPRKIRKVSERRCVLLSVPHPLE